MSSRYYIVEINKMNNFNWPKGIVEHQNDPKDMNYLNVGNVDVNMVGYDICILSFGYCTTLMKVMHV
jgi:hypothetical protein